MTVISFTKIPKSFSQNTQFFGGISIGVRHTLYVLKLKSDQLKMVLKGRPEVEITREQIHRFK